MTVGASVVIPTYNRRDVLRKCLMALFDQTYPSDCYEVVLVDDGSTDGTEEMVKSLRPTCEFIYLKQENKRQAAATRNLGIRRAAGKIVIFIDSDIISSRELVAGHIEFHRRSENLIVQGPVIHTADLENPSSQRPRLRDISRAFFCTSNVSVGRKHLLEAGLFDESFKESGWEDHELGFRLRKLGLRVKRAARCCIVYHYKEEFSLNSLPSVGSKAKRMGRNALLCYRKHPTLEVKLSTQVGLFFFIFEKIVSCGNWWESKIGRRFISFLERRDLSWLLQICMVVINNHYYVAGIKEALRLEREGGTSW